MCRMLAILGLAPVEPQVLANFRKLATDGRVPSGSKKGHQSGWGAIRYEGGKPLYLRRTVESADTDSSFDEMVSTLSSSPAGMLLLHLRKASSGPKKSSNTHPFIWDNYAFAHNGTVQGFDEPVGFPLEGDTDSERLFKLILTSISKGLDTVQAVRKTLRVVKEYSHTSLTFILSDGQRLYAFRECTEQPDYYTLIYHKRESQIIISQEPVSDGSWRDVELGHLIAVDRSLTVHDFSIDK